MVVSVCLSLCQISLESLDVGSSYMHIRYISREYRSSSYEDHRVKIKITGAKTVENLYSRNVKLLSAITPVLGYKT